MMMHLPAGDSKADRKSLTFNIRKNVVDLIWATPNATPFDIFVCHWVILIYIYIEYNNENLYD